MDKDYIMSEKPSYEELKLRVKELEKALQLEDADTIPPEKKVQLSGIINEASPEDLTFLANTAAEFFSLLPAEDIFYLIGNRLKSIVGNAIVIVSSYDKHTNLIQTKFAEGFGRHAEAIINLLNKNPVGMTMELNDPEALEALRTGKMKNGPEGLYELSFKTVPRVLCRTIEKLLNIGRIYAMGFAYRGELFGDAIIITRRGENEKLVAKKSRLIETFINQAAIALHRKLFETALRDSEQKYRYLFENANDAIFITQDGVIKFPNPRTVELTGYTEEELEKISSADLIHPEDRKSVLEKYKKGMEGDPDISPMHTHRVINKTGVELTVNTNMVPTVWEGRPAVLNFVRDITQQKRLESRIQKAHKMETIGTLAGGIAHEINNIIGIVLGNAELAIDNLPESNPANAFLTEIREASLRARDVVWQILYFTGKTPADRVPINISKIIRESMKILQATTPVRIEIRTNILCESDLILADPTEISQILINLYSNSIYAMTEKTGVLEVRLDPTTLDDYSATRYEGLTAGDYIKLTVIDNGHGIDPDIMDRIFDPYFTTRDIDEGLGIGLAVVYGIVRKHHGAINLMSRLGRGTTVEVLFPKIHSQNGKQHR